MALSSADRAAEAVALIVTLAMLRWSLRGTRMTGGGVGGHRATL